MTSVKDNAMSLPRRPHLHLLPLTNDGALTASVNIVRKVNVPTLKNFPIIYEWTGALWVSLKKTMWENDKASENSCT